MEQPYNGARAVLRQKLEQQGVDNRNDRSISLGQSSQIALA
jgi:hypothetical protein